MSRWAWLAAILAYLLVLILLILWGGIGRVDAAVSDSSDTTGTHLRACLSDEGESAFPCAWFAPGMGNHRGHSFRIYKDGRVKLITDARAFALLGDCDSDGPIYC